jgi:16S rRNA (cytosine967-C5)-methyltransferase
VSNRPRRPAKPYRRPRKDPVRFLAFQALRAVDERDAYANLVLPPLLREARAAGMEDRDAALATELVYGTLRRQGSYDAVVAACADRPLREIDPPVLDVLALGAHQLLGTRVPPHAAVSATVELARVVLGEGRAKFVNAVLRKITADDLDGWLARLAPPYDEDPEEHLALLHAHPRWVVSALWDAHGGGRAAMEELLAADNDRNQAVLQALRRVGAAGSGQPACLAAPGNDKHGHPGDGDEDQRKGDGTDQKVEGDRGSIEEQVFPSHQLCNPPQEAPEFFLVNMDWHNFKNKEPFFLCHK